MDQILFFNLFSINELNWKLISSQLGESSCNDLERLLGINPKSQALYSSALLFLVASFVHGPYSLSFEGCWKTYVPFTCVLKCLYVNIVLKNSSVRISRESINE